MEVSGLLQELLGTGHYHTVKLNDQYKTNDIFINDKLLETHLRLALRLKRRVASELEEKGQV